MRRSKVLFCCRFCLQMYSVVSVLYRLFALSRSRFNLQEYCRSFFVHLCYFSEFKVSGRNLTTQPGRSYNALPITSAGLRCNCSRNVILAWMQSVRSNWSNAKICRSNLHFNFFCNCCLRHLKTIHAEKRSKNRATVHFYLLLQQLQNLLFLCNR